jgi:hypothetical protein
MKTPPYALRFVAILGHLVFIDTHLGLVNGHTGQLLSMVVDGFGGDFYGGIDIVLVEVAHVDGLRFAGLGNHLFNL